MAVCFFTASGNCLYVARRIGETLLSIPQLMRQNEIVIEDDAVGVVCPVYNAEMPMMVREFMRKAIEDYANTITNPYGIPVGFVFLDAEEHGLSSPVINETNKEEFNLIKKQFGKQGGIVAIHGYQSFEEENLSPETAHIIGVRLASELWGDRFQVLVATHLNTEHVQTYCEESERYSIL